MNNDCCENCAHFLEPNHCAKDAPFFRGTYPELSCVYHKKDVKDEERP